MIMEFILMFKDMINLEDIMINNNEFIYNHNLKLIKIFNKSNN